MTSSCAWQNQKSNILGGLESFNSLNDGWFLNSTSNRSVHISVKSFVQQLNKYTRIEGGGGGGGTLMACNAIVIAMNLVV